MDYFMEHLPDWMLTAFVLSVFFVFGYGCERARTLRLIQKNIQQVTGNNMEELEPLREDQFYKVQAYMKLRQDILE